MAANIALVTDNTPTRESLREAAQSADWKTLPDIVSEATRVPPGAALHRHTTHITHKKADARRLGYSTLKGFVEHCLGIDWKEFSRLAEARSIQLRFHVAATEAKQVMALYRDVCRTLKRPPLDAQEFHSVVQGHLRQQRDNFAKENGLLRIKLAEKPTATAREAEALDLAKHFETELKDANNTINELEGVYARDQLRIGRLKEVGRNYRDKAQSLSKERKQLLYALGGMFVLVGALLAFS
ncbi:hypothetical protein [Ferrimonas marina]|uniref:Uncharacterized protein n=1 Tax=Ferrimonas marina TaxID=299255 RepID=A0A1M5TH48_9GAMM|nr:hypothetical protein [Ferrimonas marina]SHH50077.1 hypothetical protein SAMN02745129_2144 [Ferrimonas marina]